VGATGAQGYTGPTGVTGATGPAYFPTPRTVARYNSTTQSIPTTSNTVVQFDSADTNPGQPSVYAGGDLSYDSLNNIGRFTWIGSEAATFIVTWQIGWVYFNAGTRQTWMQYGSDAGNRYGMSMQLTTNIATYQNCSTTITMLPLDYFTIMAWHNAPAVSVNIGGNVGGATQNRSVRVQITRV
jgi:hypothetical protein